MIEEVHSSLYNNLPCLIIKGRIREEDTSTLQQNLDNLLGTDHESILIDTTHADFIDSHGLGVLIYYHKALQERKRRLVIVNTNPDSYMYKLFETTKLTQVLTIVSSLDTIL